MKTGLYSCLVLITAGAAAAAESVVVFEAEAARLDPTRTEIVTQESFRGRQGVAL
jgi:hypothetical protein